MAQALCAEQDKRICTITEWQRACGGAARRAYPYGAAYRPNHCNGDGNENGPVSTGSYGQCVTPPHVLDDGSLEAHGAFDLSGNVEDWAVPDDAAAAGSRDYCGWLAGGAEVSLKSPSSRLPPIRVCSRCRCGTVVPLR